MASTPPHEPGDEHHRENDRERSEKDPADDAHGVEDSYTLRRGARLDLFLRLRVAESEGFEPPSPYGLTVFKTAAFDRSANSPLPVYDRLRFLPRVGEPLRETEP